MEATESSEPPQSYRDVFDENLGHIKGFARYTDLLPTYYTRNAYLTQLLYNRIDPYGMTTHRDLSSVYIQTFKIAISSIARGSGLDTQLLDVLRGIVGGVGVHFSKEVDGYFALLSEFNLRLVDSNMVPVQTINPGTPYCIVRFSLAKEQRRQPSPDTELVRRDRNRSVVEEHEAGIILLTPWVQHLYQQAASDEFKGTNFSIGVFFSAICGIVAQDIAEERGPMGGMAKHGRRAAGSSKKRALELDKRIKSAVELPPLHLLRIN